MVKEYKCPKCGYEAYKKSLLDKCPLCIICKRCGKKIKECICIEGE